MTRSNLFLRLSASNKSVFVIVDFNINLLGVQKRSYAHNFLLSLQSFSFFPTIDKPTRVHNNSATLTDNILLNRFDYNINSGNIVSDVSDHDSQFCILHSPFSTLHSTKLMSNRKTKADLSDINWGCNVQNNADRSFFTFYNKLHKTLNKRAPIITLSRHRAKQISKPWVTQGIRKSIKVKNNLYYSGEKDLHKIYRNKISTLSRESNHELYYHVNKLTLNVRKVKLRYFSPPSEETQLSHYFKVLELLLSQKMIMLINRLFEKYC